MPDGHNVYQVPQPAKRDQKYSTAIYVVDIVMMPVTLLVGGTLALAGLILWGIWTAICRAIRPLFFALAGAALLMVGGVMGYAYHAYQTASGRTASAEMPPALPELPLPDRSVAPPPLAAPPATDPFGLRR